MRIFYANRDKLRDPDMIQVGQELTVPPGDKA
jgi:nucleoid-associated protein YgaU